MEPMQGVSQALHPTSLRHLGSRLPPSPTGGGSKIVDDFQLSQLENARASLAAAQVEAFEAGKIVSEVASSLRSKGVRC